VLVGTQLAQENEPPSAALGRGDGELEGGFAGGVAEDRCYGCGRCLPLCPHGLIAERDHLLAAEAVAPLLARLRGAGYGGELFPSPALLALMRDSVPQALASSSGQPSARACPIADGAGRM
jgi:Fe-S-cluster-containing hydrogenase component 2